jgi:BirA family biotin operon repressor/biotin-[acetyl-CoA-carboxylase] ligase
VGLKDVKRDRAALDPALILSELAKTSSTWRDIEVFEQVSSTNDLVIERLAGANPDAVIVVTADEQLQGKGRLQRVWQSPFGAGIALSIAIPTATFSCPISAVPLLVGLVIHRCLTEHSELVRLKWPNDLMLLSPNQELSKVGGILVQLQGKHAVIGIGINTDLSEAELPTEFATSLALAGISVQREVLIANILSSLEQVLRNPQPEWLADYRAACCTLQTQVLVTLPADQTITGFATEVLDSGVLVLNTAQGQIEITSGDVVQVRLQPS